MMGIAPRAMGMGGHGRMGGMGGMGGMGDEEPRDGQGGGMMLNRAGQSIIVSPLRRRCRSRARRTWGAR